jgi:hypothetical protein
MPSASAVGCHMTKIDSYEEYRNHLHVDARIEIGIPLAGGGIFRDWATVRESAGDEILAQISRDVLPADVRIDEGAIVDVSIWIKKDVYTCSGIVTEKVGEGVLRIRIFGSFTLRERRQFFRSYLPLKLRYAVLEQSNLDDVRCDWERRKDLEQMRFQGYDDFVIAGHKARYTPNLPLEWHDLPGSEVNLGGGGICLMLPQAVHPEELVALELYLPVTPPRQVQAIGKVIHASPRTTKGSESWRAGLQFLFLDERDRDLIFRHISVTQVAYLRKMAHSRGPDLLEPAPVAEQTRRGRLIRQVIWSLVASLVACYLVWFLVQYQKDTPNEIGQTYEKALRQYRHQ